jgi:hypothetical protein
MADHSAEIENCPPPQDAQVLKPLTDLLKGGGAKTLQWTAAAQEAFQQTKRLLVAARCHSNTPPQMPKLLSPLTPPILISEESCSKNLKTLATPWFLFSQTDRHRITLFNF